MVANIPSFVFPQYVLDICESYIIRQSNSITECQWLYNSECIVNVSELLVACTGHYFELCNVAIASQLHVQASNVLAILITHSYRRQ